MPPLSLALFLMGHRPTVRGCDERAEGKSFVIGNRLTARRPLANAAKLRLDPTERIFKP
jgi:hypothetical protein